MIPKIIHYCWFGKNKKPRKVIKCIKSWKKYCPDYKIIEWNEENFDVNITNYSKDAYKQMKWAFVADVARLYALVNFGGVYLDTDMELLKPIDCFLNHDAFIGWEDGILLGMGILGCVKNFAFFEKALTDYEKADFKIESDGLYMTNNIRITMFLLKDGLIQNNEVQTVDSITIYPKDYFYPKDGNSGIISKTKNTYAVHHYLTSFNDGWSKFRKKLYYAINRIFGKNFGQFMYKLFGRGRQ